MAVTGTLGERITQLRIQNRISQKELADYLYVNQATVSRWERSIRYPDDDLIVKMAERFGVEVSTLMDYINNTAPVVILVDDEQLALDVNVPMMQRLIPDAEVLGLTTGREALELARSKHIDAAFLDIDLAHENGMDLAASLMEIYPRINIIFLTGHPDYMKHAFDIHASGYILKPMTPEDFAHEISHLRYPVERLVLAAE